MRLAPTLTALAIAALALTGCSTASTTTPTPTRESSTTAPIARTTPTPTPTTTTAPTTAPVAAPLDTITAPAPCEEDEPCWDCATMGNLTCGPVETPSLAVSATDNTPAPQPVAAPVAAPQPVKAPAPAPVTAKPVQTTTAPAPDHKITADELNFIINHTCVAGTTTQAEHDACVKHYTDLYKQQNPCPPIQHGPNGVNLTPKDAPSYCVYAQ